MAVAGADSGNALFRPTLLLGGDVSNMVGQTFNSNEVAEILSQLWRGTVGAIVYYWMRNPSVHGFGASPSISFDQTSFRGNPAPGLSLNTLLPPLKGMVLEARKRSLDRCEWFGDDRIILSTK